MDNLGLASLLLLCLAYVRVTVEVKRQVSVLYNHLLLRDDVQFQHFDGIDYLSIPTRFCYMYEQVMVVDE